MGTNRVAGWLLIASGVVAVVAQLLALSAFGPVAYSLPDNLISDLGATECGPIEDAFGARFVCSNGYMWFNVGTIISGVLLGAAAGAWRRPPAWPLLAAAAAIIVVGAVPFTYNELIHDGAAVVHVVAYWAAMAMIMRRHRLTIVFLAVSVLGFLAFLFVPFTPGLFERLAFDTVIAWTIVAGAVLLPQRERGEDGVDKQERDAAVRRAARELG